MSDPQHDDLTLEPRLRDLIADYGKAPRPLDDEQRNRIFARVRAERSRPRRRSFRSPRAWPRRALPWVAAAAVLVLGIGIGRVLPPQTDHSPELSREAASSTSSLHNPELTELLYTLAARDYLDRTATLLTEFRQAAVHPSPEPSATPGNSTLRWAGELLLETRLLLDSPAGADTRLVTLLRELELIFAEIVQLADSSSPRDRELIRKSLEERSVLLRLQQDFPVKSRTRGA